MAKKFGKFLLFTAAIGTAAAAAYYYMQKKNQDNVPSDGEDSDYDDFSEDLEEDMDVEKSRTYVPLTPRDNGSDAPAEEADAPAETAAGDPSVPVSDPLTQESTEEASVEEFFDEEDASEEEPPIPEDN